jgi:choline dehydrogenase-like flavoprotein
MAVTRSFQNCERVRIAGRTEVDPRSALTNIIETGSRPRGARPWLELREWARRRLDLDPDVKDDWGLPAMRITSSLHPDDKKNMEFFRQKSIEVLEAVGAKKVWAPPVGESRGGAHNRGTCRMGNDPKTSVVDKYHKAHDVPNLFIVDGSNLVTGGRNHPTLTIQALAFRAAEHIIRDAKDRTLRSKA